MNVVPAGECLERGMQPRYRQPSLAIIRIDTS